MAEPTQYIFDLKEVTEALIQKQGITEGVWAVNFELGFVAGNIQVSPTETRPSGIMQISRIQLSKPNPNEPAVPWAVDARNLAKGV
ncbi:hypothetical protein [Methylocystis sp. Sn-Cys]|uniref:hypothetical protein n=1 Tax=Methylocystis sp. Sn-Cys TaxID=1701263 RepID=UPI0019240B18|nr:hypothetical protein [Methylocystis sp. Sn-Cys]MBL1257496.1 hypothetical protein [Methylocystis sp. Sn-Cys]